MTPREISYKILLNFEESNKKLEDIINRTFKSVDISPKDKKSIYNTCSGIIRNLSLLDWKIGMLFKGNYNKSLKKFKVIMRLALFEIDYLDFIPSFATVNEYVSLTKRMLDKRNSSIVNGILRTYLREQGKFKPEKKFKFKETQISVKYSFPEWMIKNWITSFGEEETEKLCRAFNQRPEFDVRINTTKIKTDEFIRILEDNKITFTKSEYFPHILKITDVQKLHSLQLFERGLCSIQDESAFLATELLEIRKGDMILDACVAPGGKFTAILERGIADINLTGCDIFYDRLMLTKQNCQRLGFEKYSIIQSDAFSLPFKKEFNKIVVDAPCSGMGTFQKSPDIKWRRKQAEIFEFQKLQIGILKAVSKLVKLNGIIIYGTCTINIEENEQVVENFLKENNSFILLQPKKILDQFKTERNFLRTFPHIHKMDGSFAAILKRIH